MKKKVEPVDFRYDEGLRSRTDKDVMATIPTAHGGGVSAMPMLKENVRIRKLTPRECWRLMGFSDEDFDKAQKVNSDTQLYKQAGNSIVVDVLEAIFGQMLEKGKWNE